MLPILFFVSNFFIYFCCVVFFYFIDHKCSGFFSFHWFQCGTKKIKITLLAFNVCTGFFFKYTLYNDVFWLFCRTVWLLYKASWCFQCRLLIFDTLKQCRQYDNGFITTILLNTIDCILRIIICEIFVSCSTTNTIFILFALALYYMVLFSVQLH